MSMCRSVRVFVFFFFFACVSVFVCVGVRACVRVHALLLTLSPYLPVRCLVNPFASLKPVCQALALSLSLSLCVSPWLTPTSLSLFVFRLICQHMRLHYQNDRVAMMMMSRAMLTIRIPAFIQSLYIPSKEPSSNH